MARKDLLSMTETDLEALTNRGTVRRVKKEIDRLQPGDIVLEQTEDGTLTCRFKDGTRTSLDQDSPLSETNCNCPAPGACRHMVALVMMYQQVHDDDEAAVESLPPWDPGKISDDALTDILGARVIKRAKKRFQTGLLVELVRSPKPMAVFHGLGMTARFMVEGDPRYVHTDAEGPVAQDAVPMAVWAFRMLKDGQEAGYISTDNTPPHIPMPVIDSATELLGSLWQDGLAGGSPYVGDHFERLRRALVKEEWIWPAENIGTIIREYDLYKRRDALFDPAGLVRAIGEFYTRVDALVHFTGATPKQLVRGSSTDAPQDLTAVRLVGLGCDARTVQGGVCLSVCFQDAAGGNTLVVERTFADPKADSQDEVKSFAALADVHHIKAPLRALGEGQLLAAKAKRSADLTLALGRKVTVNPQAFQWEKLAEPVLIQDFGELGTRLTDRPPSAVSALNAAEGLHVLAVHRIADVHFDVARQQVQAVLLDETGTAALLVHPFTDRGAEGAEALLFMLERKPESIRFVSGRVRHTPRGLVIAPIGVVWQHGEERRLLQPWIDRFEEDAKNAPRHSTQEGSMNIDPLRNWLGQMEQGLSELLLLGLKRVDPQTPAHWKRLAKAGSALGFVRLAHASAVLAATLDSGLHYSKMPTQLVEKAVDQSIELSKWLRLLPDLVSWYDGD